MDEELSRLMGEVSRHPTVRVEFERCNWTDIRDRIDSAEFFEVDPFREDGEPRVLGSEEDRKAYLGELERMLNQSPQVWAELFCGAMEGRAVTAGLYAWDLLKSLVPALELAAPEKDAPARFAVPAEWQDAWCNREGAAAWRERFERLRNLVPLADGASNLFGALKWDDFMAMLKGWGLAGDEDSGDLQDRVSCDAIDTDVNKGMLWHIGLGVTNVTQSDAEALIRLTDGMPVHVPATPGELEKWADFGYFEEDGNTAYLEAWFNAAVSPELKKTLRLDARSFAALACLAARAQNEAGWDMDFFLDFFVPPLATLPGAPWCDQGFMEGFLRTQRRWIWKGATEIEFDQWLHSPEGRAWGEKLAWKLNRKDAEKRAKKRKGRRGRR